MGLLDLSLDSNLHCFGILPSICRRSENTLKKIRFGDQTNQVFTPFYNHPTHLSIGANRLSYLTKAVLPQPTNGKHLMKMFPTPQNPLLGSFNL